MLNREISYYDLHKDFVVKKTYGIQKRYRRRSPTTECRVYAAGHGRAAVDELVQEK